jgi:hypothetical protein
MEGFAGSLIKLLQVMLCAWSDASRHIVFDEHPLEIIPRTDGVFPQTGEPVHC